MIEVLTDHDIEWQAAMVWEALRSAGWLELLSLQLRTFAELDLPRDTTDREVWHFAQERQMVLLTANRNRDAADSLEQTIREVNTIDALPVLTIGRAERVVEREYRERCAMRLLDIVLNLEKFRGTGRIFIP
jgi:hypothetical protein